MCGRYVRTTPIEQFAKLFHAEGHPECWPSHNIAPSSKVLVARNTPEEGLELAALKWGLVPAWSDEPKTEYSTINARAETVAQKPAFRSAFRHRRCLIASDGFYEWVLQPDGHKQPYSFYLKGHAPFAFAGIWVDLTSPRQDPGDSRQDPNRQYHQGKLPINRGLPAKHHHF